MNEGFHQHQMQYCSCSLASVHDHANCLNAHALLMAQMHRYVQAADMHNQAGEEKLSEPEDGSTCTDNYDSESDVDNQ